MTRKTEGMMDVKEKIQLTDVKYLWLSLNTSLELVVCIDHMCVQFQKLLA